MHLGRGRALAEEAARPGAQCLRMPDFDEHPKIRKPDMSKPYREINLGGRLSVLILAGVVRRCGGG
ncbi:hypothetical protein Vau01_085370 [Virgisporangium aurantiacum]|uniref:Uncharacterized protein n=1 Tax=Virgisporangium aurantiacum TaxID=175570 RepID=A0A8J3ZBQ0_9ACTN|nr:hypothetical protein Vau01_085370 [Virgisporangium aurantiacum]